MSDKKKTDWNEFIWILIGEAVLLGLIYTGELVQFAPLGLLRGVLGLAYVLFIPGYAMQVLFYPRNTDLDGPERAALSFGLSIAILAPVVLLLDRLPGGINLWSIVLAQVLVLTFFSIAAVWRRRQLPDGERFKPALQIDWRGVWAAQDRTGRVLFVVLGLALIMAFGLMLSFWILPSPAESFTEFYMIGSEGLAENYPRQGVVGQPLQVMIGITNREGVEADYLVRAYQDDQIIGQAGSFHLVNGQNIEAPLTIYPVADGEDVQVNLHLFRDSKPEVYRSLLLWLDVEPAP